FEKGYTPATEVMDVKTDFPTGDPTTPTFTPANYNGKFNGPVQLRFALGNSLNIPAVKMLARVGIKDVMQNGYAMGISNWQPTDQNLKSVGLSLVLGGRETTLLDETTAYSVFANKGIRQDPVFLLKVTDSKGNVLYENHPTQGPRVMPENITFLISHILLDNNARLLDFGPNSELVVRGKTVSVKTGTTNDFRDNWTLGYTPSYVVGVWVGNNDNTPMSNVASGITGAAPIWNRIISYVLKGKNDEPPQKPDDVNAVTVDALFGGLPTAGMPTRSEYFIKGTEPTSPSTVYQQKDGKVYYVVREDDPVSTDGQNRWQAGIDAWIKTAHSAADYQWYPPDDLLKSLNIQPTNTPTPTP
ncbi:MAG TPA: penicillin-binding transpeptidase domain-containing protein, partial [Patescibacteria group bacterium]|nr:penicillin-binding transpeptidase domain-containing protein [Patescibacteria group bacterium]